MRANKKIFAVVLTMICALAISPIVSLKAAAAEGDKANPSGAYIKYTVDVKKPEGETLAYNWITLKKLDYVFKEGDVVEYDVTFNFEEKGWGHIDGAATGSEATNVFRDLPGARDQNAVPLNTSYDLSDYAYGIWYHRVVEMTENEDNIGVTWVNFQVGCYPISDELEYQCITLYDNIVITNNGEVQLVIFKDETDWPETRVINAATSNCKASVELAVFTDEELDAFAAAEAAKIAEEQARAESRAEAEASRAESRELASIEASIEEASIKASEDQSRADQSAEEAANAQDFAVSGVTVIVCILAGVVLIVIVVIIIIALKKKKHT